MKNTFKKVLCTTLAAVSLSTTVTVPSSLNKPDSGNSIVNAIEAKADHKLKKCNTFDIHVMGKNSIEFKLNVNSLNGRMYPDGTNVYKLTPQKDHSIWITKFRFERYGSEIRLWGYTANPYYCDDGVRRYIWVCLSRTTYDADKHKTTVHTQCKCTDKTFGDLMNSKILKALLSPDYYLRDNCVDYINCFMDPNNPKRPIISW